MLGLRTQPPHMRAPRIMPSLPALLWLVLSTTLLISTGAQDIDAPAPIEVEADGSDPLIVYSADYFYAEYEDEPYYAYYVVGDYAEYDVNAVGAACEFPEDSDGIPVCMAAIASRSVCAGGTAYGFSVVSSTSITPARTAVVMEQIAEFISSTSRDADPTPNVYYANQVTSDFQIARTPIFDSFFFATNADQRLANSVRALPARSGLPTEEPSNIVAGINDLTSKFSQLTDVFAPIYSPIAFIITDGPLVAAQADVAKAIAELQNSTLAAVGVPVTTVAIGIGAAGIRSELEQLAIRPDLAIVARFYNTFAPFLTIATLSIDTDGDGANDCEDGCPTDPTKITPGDCAPLANTPCAGSFAFLVDASGSLREDEFVTAIKQIALFIEISSESSTTSGANANEYYAVSYTSSIRDRTNTSFMANALGGVSEEVLFFSGDYDGVKDTAIALTDTARRFELQRGGLPSNAKFAFVVTDGFEESEEIVAQAAGTLSAEGVVVIAFPPAGRFDQAVMDAIATDQSGNTRVVPVSDYAGLAPAIWSALAAIDSDGDGAIDCADSCPLDANKLLTGSCGCGVTDPAPGGSCP